MMWRNALLIGSFVVLIMLLLRPSSSVEESYISHASNTDVPGAMWTLGPNEVGIRTAYEIRGIKDTRGLSMWPWSFEDTIAYTHTPFDEITLDDWIVVDWEGVADIHLVAHAVVQIFGDGTMLTVGWNNRWTDPVLVTEENYVGKIEVIWKR